MCEHECKQTVCVSACRHVLSLLDSISPVPLGGLIKVKMVCLYSCDKYLLTLPCHATCTYRAITILYNISRSNIEVVTPFLHSSFSQCHIRVF